MGTFFMGKQFPSKQFGTNSCMSDLVGLSRHQGKAAAATNRKEGPAAAAAAA